MRAVFEPAKEIAWALFPESRRPMRIRASELKRAENHLTDFPVSSAVDRFGNLYRLDIAQHEKRNSILNELPFSSVPKVGILPWQRLHDVGRMIKRFRKTRPIKFGISPN